jgi:intein-encoded DNA endonuclease-like protein
MSQTVSILLKLRDKEQSHYYEKELRKTFFNGEVISYANLPDTKGWYEKDPVFKKLVDTVSKAKRERDNYIFK